MPAAVENTRASGRAGADLPLPGLNHAPGAIRQRNLTDARPCLRRAEGPVVNGLAHGRDALVLVDVLPPQREQLAAVKPRQDRQRRHRPGKRRTARRTIPSSTPPLIYERKLTDGSVQVFGQPDGTVTYPRKVFLTQIKEAEGNALTFTYDASLRLVAAADALGQVTTLSYEHADPLKITKVTDPFGRYATFEYDGQGRLQRLTDVLGLQSSFTYGTHDFVPASTSFRGIGGRLLIRLDRWRSGPQLCYK